MLFRGWACSGILLIASGCGQAVQSESISIPSPKKYKTIIYFQNGSDTESASDLEIRRNDSLVFSGIVAFNNIPDDWHTLVLHASDTTQRISVLHRGSAVRLDTTVTSTDTLTHIFLTYSYHKLTKSDSLRFKRFSYNADEEVAMHNLLDEPRQFSVLVMSGQISIP